MINNVISGVVAIVVYIHHVQSKVFKKSCWKRYLHCQFKCQTHAQHEQGTGEAAVETPGKGYEWNEHSKEH